MFEAYSKTPSFDSVYRTVQHKCRYVGHDENSEPIYDNYITLPTIPFIGTVKLHGTNASIGFDLINRQHWFQSRNNIIKEGHFGFTTSIYDDEINACFNFLDYIKRPDDNRAIVYGEWAGSGIQKGVAISSLPKRFYVFAIKIIRSDDTFYYLDLKKWRSYFPETDNIKLIFNSKTFNIPIDFNNPEKALELIKVWVDEVEKRCPVAFEYGIDGVGEGIVFVANFFNERLIFKVKGEKHSVTGKKPKTTLESDVKEKILQFVDYTITQNRIDQCLFELGIDVVPQNTGKVVEWVRRDALSEEKSTMNEMGLTEDIVKPFMNKKISQLYLKRATLWNI